MYQLREVEIPLDHIRKHLFPSTLESGLRNITDYEVKRCRLIFDNHRFLYPIIFEIIHSTCTKYKITLHHEMKRVSYFDTKKIREIVGR